MKLIVLADAEAEYRDAAHWYNARQPGLGDRFLDALELAFKRIEGDPNGLPLLETMEYARREFRRCLVGGFPYFVVFEVVSDEIRVVAVSHASRQPHYWIGRLP